MTENHGIKRPRSSNFSNEEKLYLLNIIKKYKHIIENKETGVHSWKSKEEAWISIEKEFNSTSSTYRPVDVIKRFYNNKKKETRKYASNLRCEMNKTGGGEAPKVKDDPIYNLTLDIINKKTVFGLKNKFDGDSNCSSAIANVKEVQKTDQYVIEEDGDEIESEIIVLEMENGETSEIETMKNICNDEHISHISETPILNRKQKRVDNSANNRWSSRRRPELSKTGNIVLQYEEVAEIKKEVLQCQLNIMKLEKAELEEKNEWERQHRQLQEKREKEQFELTKKALELDVEIKKAQLMALHAVNQANQ